MIQALALLKRAAFGLSALALMDAAGRAAMAQPHAAPAPQAACSVHLFYKAPKAVAFYNEVTVEQSAPGTYFAACGFQAGYFGIQELGNGKKVVIFSVWDAPAGDNPNAVAKDKQAEVLHQGQDVQVSRFGGEGTGQKSMWNYDWKTGQTYRFLIKAVTVDGKPSYAAYFFVPETKAWKHLATFHTPHNGRNIETFYSFAEDFRRNTVSAGHTRRALFSNGAVRDASDAWHLLDQARFGASNSRTEARDKIDAGATAHGFFLQTGGDTRPRAAVNALLRRVGKAAIPKQLPQD